MAKTSPAPKPAAKSPPARNEELGKDQLDKAVGGGARDQTTRGRPGGG